MIARKLEHIAWRDAVAAGVTLPADLAGMWAQHDDLEAESGEVNRESIDVVQAPTLILSGVGVAEAVDAERQSTHAAELVKARQRAAGQALTLLRERIARTTATSRERLIVEHLRPVVADIVTEARSLVAKLEPFAPDFDPDEVAKWATPAHLKAWRSASELQDRLDACLTAWLATWLRSTSNTDDHRLPGYLRVDAPGGVHAWDHPEQVADVDVRDGRNTNVLAIAAHADAGYCLASGTEMVELSEQVQLEPSWVQGENHPRQVLLVADANPSHVVEVKRKRAVFL